MGLFFSLYRLVVLVTFLAILSILSRTCIPWFLKLMISLSSQVILCLSKQELAVCLQYLTLVPIIFADKWTLSTSSCSFLPACCLGSFHFSNFVINPSELIKFSATSVICTEILPPLLALILWFFVHIIYLNYVNVVSYQCSDKLGLSLELGSFAAGVMISTTDFAQHTLEQVPFSQLIPHSCFLCACTSR